MEDTKCAYYGNKITPLLPDNFTLAQRRLQGLNSRLQENPNLLEEYYSIIKDREKTGISECDTSGQRYEKGESSI